MYLSLCTVLLGVWVFVRSTSGQATATTSTPAQPESTACGDVINNAVDGTYWLSASQAFECLTSVPFNAAVATRFIDYYNTTMQFQSTLAYLKDPPSSYQQPAVDFMASLQSIQDRIDSGYYKNEYAFEADLQSLIFSVNDAHVSLYGGIMSVFTFGANLYSLVTLSKDGKETPKVYISADVIDGDYGFENSTQPSAVVKINGEDVVDYLTRFAELNAIGMLEPHADWNQIMDSPALLIQGLLSTWQGAATFYPGETITYLLENGTEVHDNWLALYNSPGPTGPLQTGGDFYNFFVLGLYPASFVNNASTTGTAGRRLGIDTSNLTSWNSISPAYPAAANVVQPDLSIEGAGFLTGYFFHDISTAVLSIPSFAESAGNDAAFSSTTQRFIQKAKAAGLSRVVIDLQQNGGGDVELAFDTFGQFFPTTTPFAGSRMRAQPLANALGDALTPFWDNNIAGDPYLYYSLAANEWVVTDRINAKTGANFTSWDEFYGPRTYNGDNFTLTQQYNLSSFIFDVEAFDDFIPNGATTFFVSNYTVPPWDPSNIILLTDGQCSSTCTLFVEMMTRDAGVRSVVVGGRPFSGPMQTASGSRGAAEYSSEEIDSDMQLASAISNTSEAELPQVRDSGIAISYAGLNLRDQIRENETIPLQFLYQAADCRIYFTHANVYNYSRLWRDAANAAWNDTSLCVTNSTGYASNATETPPPTAKLDSSVAHYILQGVSTAPSVDFNIEATGGLPDSNGVQKNSGAPLPCSSQGRCTNGGECKKFTAQCSGSKKKVDVGFCIQPCTPAQGGILSDSCGPWASCKITGTANSHGNQVKTGRCDPDFNNIAVPCAPSGSDREDLSKVDKTLQGLLRVHV